MTITKFLQSCLMIVVNQIQAAADENDLDLVLIDYMFPNKKLSVPTQKRTNPGP